MNTAKKLTTEQIVWNRENDARYEAEKRKRLQEMKEKKEKPEIDKSDDVKLIQYRKTLTLLKELESKLANTPTVKLLINRIRGYLVDIKKHF